MEIGIVVSSKAEYSFTVTSDATLEAIFKPIAPVKDTMTVQANDATFGSVTINGEESPLDITQGEEATFVAVANTGYEFTVWTDQEGNIISNEAIFTETPTAALNYTANFVAITYMLYADPNDVAFGAVTINGEESPVEVNYGSEATFEATAVAGYEFVNWTDAEGALVSAENPYIVESVTEEIILTANFILIPTPIYTRTATVGEG